ncbi:unnamed protein product [Brassica rapa subsp. trilocularis]
MSMNAQKRLAASVMNCGKEKLWLDPSESKDISMANFNKNKNYEFHAFQISTRLKSSKNYPSEIERRRKKKKKFPTKPIRDNHALRTLVKDGLIIRKLSKIHSRAHARTLNEAKRKGRHSGSGKRKGTREARQPTKFL